MLETTLTTQERHQLLAVLQELDPSAPPEQRRGYRRKVLMDRWIRPIGGAGRRGSLRASVVNVSPRGLGLNCQGSLAIGDKFLITLHFRGVDWLVLCQVRNCRKTGEKVWHLGASFVDRVEKSSPSMRVPANWQRWMSN